MPLRLPSRRPAGPRTAPFRRRAPPTPQATRLMKVSLGAGLLFVVLLGIVFIPTALRFDRPPQPTIVLTETASSPLFLVEVTRVNVREPLASYRGELNITNMSEPDRVSDINVDIPQLGEGEWAGGLVSFADVDGDGTLSIGDRFTIRPQTTGSWRYELFIFYASNAEFAVGYIRLGA